MMKLCMVVLVALFPTQHFYSSYNGYLAALRNNLDALSIDGLSTFLFHTRSPERNVPRTLSIRRISLFLWPMFLVIKITNGGLVS